jgi:hypothetical protein
MHLVSGKTLEEWITRSTVRPRERTVELRRCHLFHFGHSDDSEYQLILRTPEPDKGSFD